MEHRYIFQKELLKMKKIPYLKLKIDQVGITADEALEKTSSVYFKAVTETIQKKEAQTIRSLRKNLNRASCSVGQY